MLAASLLVLATSLLATVSCQQNGAIRLYNYGYSNTSTSGIVEVYYNSKWSTICQYDAYGVISWSLYEADVACQQLGYAGASSYSSSGQTNYGNDQNPMEIYDVDCSLSSYLVLLQCSYYYGTVSACNSHDDQVTVSCYSTKLTDSPYTGMVRLQDGYNVTSGRVEVYCNGQWGTLCDVGFTSSVALTVCYQLGYNDYVYYHSGDNPGSSSEPIWLSNYYCTYSYSCIHYCQTCPAESITSCQHSQDVSVACEYNTGNVNYGNTLYTCNYYLSTAAIVGIIIGAIVAFGICLCLFIGIPVCICCCLGIGVGAAAGRHHRHYDTV